MNVLVLGGTGFLSSVVVTELQSAGHEVTILTRGSRPAPAGAEALVGDRRDVEQFLRQVEGRAFDAVVDCICYTAHDAELALRAFSGRVRHFLMISTDFVYGPRRTLPIAEHTYTRAMSQYGRDKAAAEEVFLHAWRTEGFPATLLRPPHIMGAGGHLGTGSLHGRDPMLLDRLDQGAPVVLLEGGALLIQPVVHRDVGRACAAALGKEATLGQAYNVAGPDAVTTREYYDLVAATLGVTGVEYLSLPSELFVRAFPDRAPFAHHRTYDVSRLRAETGYAPETGIQHAVFEMVDWLQARDAAQPYVETERDTNVAALCRAFGDEMVKVLRA
ncbi:MAG: NAD-dependent epimerase/dehydratase family protein [Armatimonadota bacterium]